MEVVDVQISCVEQQKSAKKLPKLYPRVYVYPDHQRPQTPLAFFQLPSCQSGEGD